MSILASWLPAVQFPFSFPHQPVQLSAFHWQGEAKCKLEGKHLIFFLEGQHLIFLLQSSAMNKSFSNFSYARASFSLLLIHTGFPSPHPPHCLPYSPPPSGSIIPPWSGSISPSSPFRFQHIHPLMSAIIKFEPLSVSPPSSFIQSMVGVRKDIWGRYDHNFWNI